MIVGALAELEIFDVQNRGVPNDESIAIRVNETVNLGQFGIMLGATGAAWGGAIPVRDFFFWFGNGMVNAGDFIFVYTGPGSARFWQPEGKPYTIYSVHWGRKTTIFNDPTIVPFLFKVESVQIPSPPRQLPEAGQPSALPSHPRKG